MNTGKIVFLMLAFLFLCFVQSFAAQPSESETVSAPAEEVKAVSADQPNATSEGIEQEAGDDSEESLEQEEEKEEEVLQIADPLYPWNNAMYHFNDKLYFWALKPVAKGYSAVFPEDIRVAVSNVFYTIATPIRLIGDLMQLKLKKAGNELVRLVYNSTVGVFGLVDAAKKDLNIPRHDEDLGQTLGTYGIGNGIYIVWPFIGPSTLRDTVGLVGDGFLTPVYYLNPWTASMGVEAYGRINGTSLHIGEYEDFKESAIDPYIAIRDAYVQHRQKKVEE